MGDEWKMSTWSVRWEREAMEQIIAFLGLPKFMVDPGCFSGERVEVRHMGDQEDCHWCKGTGVGAVGSCLACVGRGYFHGKAGELIFGRRRRTKSEVLLLQNTPLRSCCNRFADYMSCECLQNAEDDTKQPQVPEAQNDIPQGDGGRSR